MDLNVTLNISGGVFLNGAIVLLVSSGSIPQQPITVLTYGSATQFTTPTVVVRMVGGTGSECPLIPKTEVLPTRLMVTLAVDPTCGQQSNAQQGMGA